MGGMGGTGGTGGAAGSAGKGGTAGTGGAGGTAGSAGAGGSKDASTDAPSEAGDSSRAETGADAQDASAEREAGADGQADTSAPDVGPDTTAADAPPNETGAEAGSDGSAPNPCDVSTTACITSRDKPGDPADMKCSTCMTSNGCLDHTQMGGTCEDTTGTAPAACSTALGSASAVSETKVCLRTLKDIFASQCAATQQLTPCLCGNTDAGQCLAGTVAPTGPLVDIYKCELGSTAPEITNNFTVQTFGAGQANALVQCAGAFGCDCF
jgi:hypothetical protein